MTDAVPFKADDPAVHDVAVVGGGPAGCTAALYCAGAGLDVLVLERLAAGGQMALTDRIDNYPGFEQGVDGLALGEQMRRQAERFGARFVLQTVRAASLTDPVKRLETSAGDVLARSVILATGASPRLLDLPGEAELTGRGVHYCATCDGWAYRGRTVAVVGGGDAAAAEALHLARLCRRVILIHRRDTLRAANTYHDPLRKASNVELRLQCAVSALRGKDRLTGLELTRTDTGETSSLAVEGLFVSIGRVPVTGFLDGAAALTDGGYLNADEQTKTNLPGVFAAGDVRAKAVRQVVTAAADGAAAARAAQEYLSEGAGD